MGKNYDKSLVLREEYSMWKKEQQDNKRGFFPIYQDFLDFLPSLSGGACLLYTYLGLHAKNKSGELYHDINRIATFFGRSTRTIREWMSELEEKQLIYRMQIKFNGVTYTYLMPYGINSKNFLEKIKNKLAEIDENANESEY